MAQVNSFYPHFNDLWLFCYVSPIFTYSSLVVVFAAVRVLLSMFYFMTSQLVCIFHIWTPHHYAFAFCITILLIRTLDSDSQLTTVVPSISRALFIFRVRPRTSPSW